MASEFSVTSNSQTS
uniref:Uncharacterized protein n=1 Tax=Arundo donax TaxID=35708 RepID=A0A0A8ZBB9_ARUDO